MNFERTVIAELPLFSLNEIIDSNPNAPPCGIVVLDVVRDDDGQDRLVIACGPDKPLFVATLSMAATRALALALLEASSKEKN